MLFRLPIKESRDIFQIGVFQRFFISIRVYPENGLGYRWLGEWRYALDILFFSVILERYYV